MMRLGWVLLLGLSQLAWGERTVLHYFQPFAKPEAYQIHWRVQGQCLEQSKFIKREDAWRCQAVGQTYDPCFLSMAGKQLTLLCLPSPFATEAVEIQLTRPLNSANQQVLDMSETYPWMVKLADGSLCQPLIAYTEVEGLPAHYQCENGSRLFGHVQRCQSMWKMLAKDSKGTNRVEIAEAWF